MMSHRRYLVKHDEPQSVFTGKQQREGVSIMPFLVASVWRPRGQMLAADQAMHGSSAAVPETSVPVVGDGISNAVPDLAARVEALKLEDAAGDGAADAGPPITPETVFDWTAYRAVWQMTPIDEAITAMFAEFAVLHAELSGYTCNTAPLPLTLDIGKCIAERAQRFVTEYVTPILGPQSSTKVHKLLCHVLDAIRMHGNISNGNSSLNEQMHKDDKPYYARTNRDRTDFTRQLVVQAQGARIIQRRIADEQEAKAAASDECAADGVRGSHPGNIRGEDQDEDDSFCFDGDALEPGDDAAGAAVNGTAAAATGARTDGASTRTVTYHLRPVVLSSLAQVPGLRGIAAALGLSDDAYVRVCSFVSIDAVFDCGTKTKQLLYASPSFRGEPWFDSVLFCPTEDPMCVSVAEVRAIVRGSDGDVAVVAEMKVVAAVPGCPLVARGCTRLAWNIPPGETDVRLKAIPIAAVRRVLHVVPDFADLVMRRGLDAKPAAPCDPVQLRSDMRFFINAFYPWRF